MKKVLFFGLLLTLATAARAETAYELDQEMRQEEQQQQAKERMQDMEDRQQRLEQQQRDDEDRAYEERAMRAAGMDSGY